MTVPRPALALLAALTLGLAACGGDDGGGGGGEPSASGPQERFAESCGNCHTLGAAGTEGQVGPNLDELKPDQARVLAAIASGPGGMPAGILEGDEADAVAGYVASASGR